MAALAAPKPYLQLIDRLDPEMLARLGQAGVLQGTSALSSTEAILSLDWPELERVLPDGGLPRGVIEIASSGGARVSKGVTRGGATTIALSATRAIHAADGRAWCAWITESSAPSLFAPAVAQAGVDLERLLVVRPASVDLARTVVKVAASGAFDLVVVDAPSGLDGKLSLPSSGSSGGSRSRVDGSVVIRKLALASEEKGTTFIVLTNIDTARAVPWPVALRVEVERRPEAIALRVTKDRRGRASSQHVVRVSC
jgi:recombination protein RecA